MSPPIAEDDVDAAYESAKAKPCYVSRVMVEGEGRTRPSVLKPSLQTVKKGATLAEIQELAHESAAQLLELDVFEKVDILCDIDADKLEEEEEEEGGIDSDARNGGENEMGAPTPVVIKVSFVEKSPLEANIGTFRKNGEHTLEFNGLLRNRFGRAEQFELDATLGWRQSCTFSASFLRPRVWSSGWNMDARLFAQNNSSLYHSSFTERSTGASIGFTRGDHNLAYECSWRELKPFTGVASREIRRDAGHCIKSAARWNWGFSVPLPSHALQYSFMSSFEVAGLGPDANLLRYVKEDMELQVVKLLSRNVRLLLGVQGGVIVPWGPKNTITVSDRFMLGGPVSLRGFQQNGVGPMGERVAPKVASDGAELTPSEEELAAKREKLSSKSQYDALGGNVMCALYASLNFTLPFLSALQVRLPLNGHVFVNSGNCVGLSDFSGSSVGDMKRSGKLFFQNFRSTLGCGLVFASPMGRCEFNYCWRVRALDRDQTQTGFQFGFSTAQ